MLREIEHTDANQTQIASLARDIGETRANGVGTSLRNGTRHEEHDLHL
jgi:hypothetical protein